MIKKLHLLQNKEKNKGSNKSEEILKKKKTVQKTSTEENMWWVGGADLNITLSL